MRALSLYLLSVDCTRSRTSKQRNPVLRCYNGLVRLLGSTIPMQNLTAPGDWNRQNSALKHFNWSEGCFNFHFIDADTTDGGASEWEDYQGKAGGLPVGVRCYLSLFFCARLLFFATLCWKGTGCIVHYFLVYPFCTEGTASPTRYVHHDRVIAVCCYRVERLVRSQIGKCGGRNNLGTVSGQCSSAEF